MELQKVKSFCTVAALLLFCSGKAISQDLNQSLSEAKAFCSGLTASNRAMAKAAGV